MINKETLTQLKSLGWVPLNFSFISEFDVDLITLEFNNQKRANCLAVTAESLEETLEIAILIITRLGSLLDNSFPFKYSHRDPAMLDLAIAHYKTLIEAINDQ